MSLIYINDCTELHHESISENHIPNYDTDLISEEIIHCDVPKKSVMKLKLTFDARSKNSEILRKKLETLFTTLSDTHKVRIINTLTIALRSRRRTFKRFRQSHLYGVCDAKTSFGTICHRRCQNVLENYCPTHLKDPAKYEHVEKKERTPRAKFDLSQLDKRHYFEVQLKEIDGELVYVDDIGLLYSKTDYTLIGIIRENGEAEKF